MRGWHQNLDCILNFFNLLQYQPILLYRKSKDITYKRYTAKFYFLMAFDLILHKLILLHLITLNIISSMSDKHILSKADHLLCPSEGMDNNNKLRVQTLVSKHGELIKCYWLLGSSNLASHTLAT